MNNIVSVLMITYGHQEYIHQAIEGVLMQKCDFEVEFVIANDCSPDNTEEVIQNILKNHPKSSWIKYIKHEKNIGASKNFINGLINCTGKYIALCEGDDYWTDPLKLQKQVNFMKINKQCVLCFHKALRIYESEKIDDKNIYPKGIKLEILNEKDFFNITSIPTASVMFSNRIEIPKFNHSHGDFILYCTLLSNGKAGFIDELMSVYRRHDDGISFNYSLKPYLERRISELKIESEYSGFSRIVRDQINKILTNHIEYYLNKNRGSLNLPSKMYYVKILLGQKTFYKLSFKKYMSLAKTLIK